MKLQLRFTYIILSFFSLFSVLFLSCGESIKNPRLLQAESLVEFYPDSALSLLNNITPSELSNDDEKMLRRLLILAAKDRKYEGQPDSVEIKTLLNYFICNDRLRRIHPLVYYYAGRTYSDLRIYAKALGYYKKSLRTIDDKGDILLERRIHSQIATIYSENGIKRHALKESKIYAALSDSIARLDPSYENRFDKVTAYLFLGYAYRRTQMNDSALLIYAMIAPEVKALKDSVKMTEYNVGLANLYIADNKPEKADSIIKNNRLSVDKASKHYVYISVAEVERHLPSPNFNEAEMLELLNSDDLEAQYYAAKTLADIADMKNDGRQLLRYSRLAHNLSYRLQKATNDASLVEMERIIDESEIENENLNLQNDNKKIKIWILYTALIALVAILATVIIMIRSRMNRMRLALEIESMKAENRRLALNYQSEISRLQEELDSDEKLQKLREFENNISLAEITEEITSSLLSPAATITDEQFARLKSALMPAYPGFIKALDEMNLKTKEYQDAMLIKINVPQKLCAACFRVTPQAVANWRTRLYKRFCGESEFKNWKDFILSL